MSIWMPSTPRSNSATTRRCAASRSSSADPAAAIAQQIKERIKREIGLIASVGVASNKFLAKLASDHSKPDGLVVLPPERVAAFLEPLPVSRLWGVGARSEKRLQALGIRTV